MEPHNELFEVLAVGAAYAGGHAGLHAAGPARLPRLLELRCCLEHFPYVLGGQCSYLGQAWRAVARLDLAWIWFLLDVSFARTQACK